MVVPSTLVVSPNHECLKNLSMKSSLKKYLVYACLLYGLMKCATTSNGTRLYCLTHVGMVVPSTLVVSPNRECLKNLSMKSSLKKYLVYACLLYGLMKFYPLVLSI
jgi:hypothetical protein